jgi:hypothetical protein
MLSGGRVRNEGSALARLKAHYFTKSIKFIGILFFQSIKIRIFAHVNCNDLLCKNWLAKILIIKNIEKMKNLLGFLNEKLNGKQTS